MQVLSDTYSRRLQFTYHLDCFGMPYYPKSRLILATCVSLRNAGEGSGSIRTGRRSPDCALESLPNIPSVVSGATRTAEKQDAIAKTSVMGRLTMRLLCFESIYSNPY